MRSNVEGLGKTCLFGSTVLRRIEVPGGFSAERLFRFERNRRGKVTKRELPNQTKQFAGREGSLKSDPKS
ncbi:MAG: hypothetical protein IIC50_05015 [Planctomycetes bacterium]|nr:hypothetical protein [Planctomycetota bacterium]